MYGRNPVSFDFTDPEFTKDFTSQSIWSSSKYDIKFLPNYKIALYYFKYPKSDEYSDQEDSELPKFMLKVKTDPFIIIQPLEHKSNESFRFSLINQDYCIIISLCKKEPPFFLYNFIKSINSTAVIFPDLESRKEFEDFFYYKFIHVRYYKSDSVVKSFLSYLNKDIKKSDFFNYQINHDTKINYTLYEAISQVMNSVYAYFIKRHEFFQYKIKMNHSLDFSKNYEILSTLYSCKQYDVKIVFHSICNMLFIYKTFKDCNQMDYIYHEKRYIENQTFHSILKILGIFREKNEYDNNDYIILAYEYTPFFKLNDENLSKNTIENCLLRLLKELDVIHSKEYIVSELNVNTVLFSIDNSIFFTNYHQFLKASNGFENDMIEFGRLINEIKSSNKYLNELALCTKHKLTNNIKIGYYPCFPVTQYFIYRIFYSQKSKENRKKEEIEPFVYHEKRKDNKVLFENSIDSKILSENSKDDKIRKIKTLLFCYAEYRDIDPLLNELPDVEKNSIIYLHFGKEMLDFNEAKGFQILNRVINSNSKMKENAYYIIGKYYFFKKDYIKMQDYFTKITKNGKIYYIIGRIHQMKLFSNAIEESLNASNYLEKSTKYRYWRSFYREGLKLLTEKKYEDAIKKFKLSLESYEESNEIDEDDIRLFSLLGDDHKYLYGMILYNMAICYKFLGEPEMMITYFKQAEERECKLAYAPLAYAHYITREYQEAFEILQKAVDCFPLNRKLVIETTFKLVEFMVNADTTDAARLYLNLSIKLNSKSYTCDEDTRNFLVKNIQHYAVIVANHYNYNNKIFDAVPCYALAAAFGSQSGFLGLAASYFNGRGIKASVLNSLICLKQFFIASGNDTEFMNKVDEYIKMYPIYMQRSSYFEVGSFLFLVSKSPYIPFDFLIKAASLSLPQVIIKDFRYITELEDKISTVLNVVLRHYQNDVKVPEIQKQEEKES